MACVYQRDMGGWGEGVRGWEGEGDVDVHDLSKCQGE